MRKMDCAERGRRTSCGGWGEEIAFAFGMQERRLHRWGIEGYFYNTLIKLRGIARAFRMQEGG